MSYMHMRNKSTSASELHNDEMASNCIPLMHESGAAQLSPQLVSLGNED